MSAKKTRPKHGDPLTPGMSERDIAIGMNRTQLWQCKVLASMPKDEFEAALADKTRRLTTSSMVNLALRKARSVRRCPHCGFVLAGGKTEITQKAAA